MSDICAVIPFALHDESLGPNHLFRGAQSDRHAENLSGEGMLKPDIVNPADAVSGAEDEIDEEISAEHLSQPVGKRNLRLITGAGEHVESAVEISSANDDVKILRVTKNFRATPQHVCAADKKWNLLPV